MIMHRHYHRSGCGSILLWPFIALWDLVAFILGVTGRLVGATIGLVLMIAGIVVSLTVVGAIIGIPLAIFGFLLMVRSLF
jgi:hypothetical protein